MSKKVPICNIKGCENGCHVSGKKSDGSPRYRKVCAHHHFGKIVKKHGANSMVEVLAHNGIAIYQRMFIVVKCLSIFSI